MRKNKNRRVTSTVLSIAMTAVSVLGDVKVPVFAAESNDTGGSVSVTKTISSITSDYLKKNLNEQVGKEVSEYTVSDIDEQSYTYTSLTEEEETGIVPVTGNGTVAAYLPRIAKISLKEDTEDVILNSELGEVQTQTAYDENGLAATYHYVLLNYSLVEESVVTADTTIDDVWENNPQSFIASIPAYVNVYALEGSEDYFVAFADPSAINGTGQATYADFTNFDTENPTIYNDVVSFDAESGIIYIPKSFFYNEDGEEVIKELQAQVLVPYSFESTVSNITVDIESSASVDVLTGLSTISSAALDVSMRVPVAKEGTTGLEDTSFKVYLNDDPLETENIASYDSETGELTIAVNPATIYALRIEVSDPAEEVYSSLTRDILLASTADIPLGDVLLAADSYEHVTSAADMTQVPSNAFSLTYDDISAGDLFTYSGRFTYCGSPVKGTTNYNVIKATAQYCYYANDTTQQQTEYAGIESGAMLSTFTSAGHDIVRRPDLQEGGAAFNLFNVLTTLPKGSMTSIAGSKSTAGHTITFTTNLSKLSGYPTDTSGTKNNTLAALHCAHITNGINTDGAEGAFSVAKLYCRVLYVYTSTSENYAVVGIITPCVGVDGKSQAGYGMYKVRITKTTPRRVYGRFYIKKSDAKTNTAVNNALYIAAYDKDDLDNAEEVIAKAIKQQNVTDTTSKIAIAKPIAGALPGVSYAMPNINDSFYFSWLEEEGRTKTIYVREIIAADDYQLDPSTYTVNITGDESTITAGTITSVSSTNAGRYPVTFTNNTSTYDFISVKERETPYYAAFDLEKVSTASNSTTVPNAIYAVFTGSIKTDETVISLAAQIQENATKNAATATTYGAKRSAAASSAYSISAAANLGFVGFIQTGSDGTGQIYKYTSATSSISTINHALITCNTDSPQRVILVEILAPSNYKLNPNVYMFYVNPNGNKSTDYDTAVNATTITSSGTNAPFCAETSTETNLWSTYGSLVNNTKTTATTVRVKDVPNQLYGVFGVKKQNSSGTAISGMVFNVYTRYSNGTLSGKLTNGITTGTDGCGYLDVSSVNDATISGTWYNESSTQKKTFYVQEDQTSATNHLLVWKNTVYKVEITGTTDSTTHGDCTVTVTNMSTDAAVTTSTHGSGTSKYTYFTQSNTVRQPLYGIFGVYKYDDNGDAVKNLQFDVYGENPTSTSTTVATMTTTNGYASLNVSTLDPSTGSTTTTWYDQSATGTATNTKTFYVRENRASAEGLHLVYDSTVYKVVVTGGTSNAASCTVSVSKGTNFATSVSTTAKTNSSGTTQYYYYSQQNQRQKTYGQVQLYGRFELEKIDDLGCPMEGISFNIVSATQISGDYKASTRALSEVTTTDEDGHMVLQSGLVDASIITDEAGAAVYVLPQPWYEVSAKTWVLYVQEDQNNAYYHADPNIYRVVITGTRDSEMRSCSFSTENLTGYEQMYLGKENADENVNTASGDKLIITNDRVRLFGMLSLKKDNGVYTEDGDTVSLEYIEGAQFEIYADESLSPDSYVTTIFTDQEGYAEFRFSTARQTEYNDWMLACGTSGEDRTSVGSYEKTLYLKEVDNDRIHSLFPFVIKAVVKGVRDDAGYASIQEAEEHCTVTYEILETDEAVEAWSAYLGYDHLVHQEHSNQLRVSDLPLALNVDKKDFDSGENLKGATLSVYEVATKADGSYELDENGNPVHGKRIAQWVSDGTTHQVRGMTLTWSTPEDPYIYVLAEETGVDENGSYNTPDGYITADDIPFIITSDNHIVRLDNENLSADTYSDNNVTVWNRSAKIRITKTDASDEWKELSVAYGVSGAHMQLYYVDESGHEILKCAWWTVAGEAFEVDNCRTGTYRLYEDCAPAGFATYDNGNAEGPTNYYEFTVEQQLPVGEHIQDFEIEEQNIRVKVEKIDPDYPDVYVQGAILSINYPVYNADGTLAVNADGSYKTNGVLTYTPQNSLVNAVDGVVTCRWVTSEEETIFHEIPAGTYILKELTAPTEHGYVLAKDMVITVADTAELQIFEMEEDHTEVAVSKVDTVTKEPVAGAVLSIYSIRTDENGAYVVNADGTYAMGDVLTYSYPDGAVQTCTMTTAADIIRLEYIPAGTYVLHEDMTPAGYATAPDLVFTVDAVGQKEQVQDVQLNNAYEVCDQPLTVSISKTDITSGEEIEGAHLQILRAVQDENGDWMADGTVYTTIKGEVCDWISGTDGKDEDGNLLPHDILYIEAGTYILHEVTAPTEQGYVKVSDIVFEIIDTEAVQRVEMHDEITRVHISKKDLTDGREIPGAKLTIYVKNSDGTRGEAVYSWTTDGTPYEIEHIPVGDYILEEVSAPDRYQRAEAVEFTVTETGEIQKVEMFDDRTYGKAEVYKTDEDGNPVAGAEFAITRADTGEVVDVITTDENGYAISRELPIDELRSITQDALTGEPVSIIYTITETFAPAGVVLDCTPEDFQFCYADDETPVVTITFTKVNQHQQGRIAVIKKGLVVIGTEKVETRYGDVDKLVFGYVYLPGVEFTIYADKDLKEVVTTVTTDDEGYALSDYIDVGTYFIVETKTPAGYAKDDTVYEFTITGQSQREDAIEYVLDVTKEIENHLCSSTLNIYKVGTDTECTASRGGSSVTIPLEGVYFGVYADEDIKNIKGDVVIKKDDCLAIIKTNSEGIASMTDNLPAGKYYYKELKTLDQFVLDETRYAFTVSLANDNVVIDINKTNPLLNHAKYGKLTVHKVDQYGNPIGAGAVFALTNLDTGETWTLTTDETSTISIDGLPIGRFNENGEFIYYNYELEEIQAPDNYRLPENESDRIINFTFSADSNEADAISVSFTVKNVILGITDFSMAGGITMLLMAVAMMIAAFRKRKELAV